LSNNCSSIEGEARSLMLDLFSGMELIRQAELRLSELFADSEIPGFIHSSIGQEAVAVGVMAALRPMDTIASTHRGHGHALARGVDVARLFLETMGREEGYCRGRGGSMHVADASVGMLGANGIVGAGLSIALGSALAHQVRATGGIATVFFGDGALSEGLLHECLNLAKLWTLPLLFVCEHNGWSEFTPTAKEFVGDLQRLAAAFDIPASRVDGNDVLAIRTAAVRFSEALRAGEGPRLLECRTRRVRGHYEGDRQRYRDPTEVAEAGHLDPIRALELRLIGCGETEQELARVRRNIAERVAAAVVRARNGREPAFRAAAESVYAPNEEART
jgi:acetoin:2,6-dichlorophenolindophenol oxidoreductase subunit alpha